MLQYHLFILNSLCLLVAAAICVSFSRQITLSCFVHRFVPTISLLQGELVDALPNVTTLSDIVQFAIGLTLGLGLGQIRYCMSYIISLQ